MATYQVTRLSIIFDGKSGRLQALRTRPGGFALPIYEPEFDIPSSEVTSSYQVGTADGQIKPPFVNLAARELLIIRTTWAGRQQKITRTFRTLRRALAQRVEILDYHYCIVKHQWSGAIPLLRFTNYVAYLPSEIGFQLQTIRYHLHARVEAHGITEWSVENLPDSNEAVLTVRGEGDCELRVSFGIVSSEKKAQDPAVYLIPVPLDEFTFLSTALAPALRAAPLSREPRFNVVVPSPSIFYMSSESALEALYPKGGSLKRFWNFLLRRDDPSVALPPRNYPLGSLIRMSDILIYKWREDIPDLLNSIIAYLRGLGENHLASLQRILVVSDTTAGTEYFHNLKRDVGKIQLPRVEPAIPEECHLDHRITGNDLSQLPSAIATLEEEFDQLIGESPFNNRAAFRQAVHLNPLPPVVVPAGVGPALSAPFIAASRLRGGPAVLGESTAIAGPWPLGLQARSLETLSAEVARFLLTDLVTHQAFKSMEENQPYEAVWLNQLERLHKGEIRADRVILVSVTGGSDVTDRMKMLPAVLYSTEVPSPILPFLVSEKQQRRILSSFNDYALAGHEACLSVAKGDGISPGQQFYKQLEKMRRSFQNELGKVLPAEYLDFLRLAKPKEVVNFSVLPLEWLEVDDIGLGYLSKITTIRSARPSTDIGYCADLATAYNSLVAHDLRVSRNEFRALIIAPEYHEKDQGDVNAFIQASADGVERRLKKEEAKGREITYTIIREASAVNIVELLKEDWAMVAYIGHAGSGVLSLPDDSDLSPVDLPEKAFFDTTVLLIGCDTQGAANLAGSVASQFLSLGARGVFSTYFPIALGPLAENMFFNLLVYMLDLNYTYGDVLALTRFSMLWEHWLLFHSQEIGLPIRGGFKWLSKADTEYENYRDTWDKFYKEVIEEFRLAVQQGAQQQAGSASEYTAMIGKRAQIAGLAISFTGDLHARLFDF